MSPPATQGALFGDPAPLDTAAPARAARIGTNDLDLVAAVIRHATDPGYLLAGPTDRVLIRDPAGKDTVEAVPRYEAETVHQLLDAGHLTTGGTHHVACDGRDGPARAVLVPKPTRALIDRWAALQPLPAAAPAPSVPPGPVRVYVDVVRPGLGLVTCGAGDWSGSIVRQDGGYLVETEHGAVIGRARSYRAGAERLARHHGHKAVTVEIDHEHAQP